MIPKTRTYSIGYIIDCKSVKKEEMERGHQDGLAQIREKEYMAAFGECRGTDGEDSTTWNFVTGKKVTVRRE